MNPTNPEKPAEAPTMGMAPMDEQPTMGMAPMDEQEIPADEEAPTTARVKISVTYLDS
jgi:hypothetical protein